MPLTPEQTSHACFGDRPVALADRCAAEGLDNAASTIRGLLDEREALRRVLAAESTGQSAFTVALLDATRLLRARGLITP